MFTTECSEQCYPEELGRVRLTAAESGNSNATIICGDADTAKDGLAVGWLSGEERGSKKVVRFSSTHGRAP
jgi:hypothetical protein